MPDMRVYPVVHPLTLLNEGLGTPPEALPVGWCIAETCIDSVDSSVKGAWQSDDLRYQLFSPISATTVVMARHAQRWVAITLAFTVVKQSTSRAHSPHLDAHSTSPSSVRAATDSATAGGYRPRRYCGRTGRASGAAVAGDLADHSSQDAARSGRAGGHAGVVASLSGGAL